MKRLLILFLFLPVLSAYAQKQAYNWYFGNNSGLSFATNPPTALTDGQINASEGCAAISDKDGALLFYSDGKTVWNRNHITMTNGTGLKGDFSSTQSTTIVPWPGDPNRYFIFTIDAVEHSLSNGLNYSVVDMSKQSGMGEVIQKNIKLLDTVCEKITAVRHRNKRDFWVVVQKWGSNGHYAFHITPTGVNTIPVVSYIGVQFSGMQYSRAIGYMKCSPDGQRLVAAHWDDKRTELFKFNDLTGAITDLLTIPAADGSKPYGVEFSPDGEKLYIVSCCELTNQVYQYNLKAGSGSANDILNSQQVVGFTVMPMPMTGCLQLGPDGKIYMARSSQDSIGVIEFPNMLGPACGFKPDGIYLKGKQSTLGLPNFIQSYFERGSFTVERFCFADSALFKITIPLSTVDSVRWNFDDPSTGVLNSSRDTMPYHIYSDTGTYKPRLIMYFNSGITDTITETIDIVYGEKPYLGLDKEICDSVSIKLSLPAGFSGIRWSTGPLDTLRTLTVSSNGTYIVKARGASTCLNADTINIAFHRATLVLPKDTQFCAGDSVLVDAGNAGHKFTWSSGDTTQKTWIRQDGIYTVRIRSGACHWDDTVKATRLIKGSFNLGNDTTLCSGQLLPLKIKLPGLSYSWSTGQTTDSITANKQGTYIGQVQTTCGLVTDTVQLIVLKTAVVNPDSIRRWCNNTITLDAGNPGYTYQWGSGETTRTISVSQLGTYTVTISNNGACPVNYTFWVKSGCPVKIWIPSAFTPNGDNLNEVFYAETTGDIMEFRLEVFNRWGERIFTADQPSDSWNGIYKGSRCPDGVYYWTLNCKGYNAVIRRSGTLTLLH